MYLVLLGVGIGLLTLIPPGPVSLTLVQLGVRRGHRPALHGALGIAAGDLVLAAAAVVIVGTGSTLPPAAFTATQMAAAALLVVLGVFLVCRPTATADSMGRIERPGRTLFVLTSIAPTALGAWIALLAAMPFATDSAQLSRFAAGVVIASCLWHPVLGALASAFGARLTDRDQARLSQLGGLVMVAGGCALVVL